MRESYCVGADGRERIEIARPLRLDERFADTTELAEIERIPVMRRRVVGIELDRAAEAAAATLPIPIEAVGDERERDVRF